MAEHRPNPDMLLKQIQDEERQEKSGKLKIYLGAAPGVGKTHEMLSDALAERSKGLDVVIGIAESHGRKEIDAMLCEFEILPRQQIDYHGRKLTEFDIDAALKRHPGLILVDEMAHVNAYSLRHKKRWQDIKELLDRGIDVYTTLNVQHIESLNNDVSRIIQAPVKETVPDSMIERADLIELIDIPPEELLKRLHEGKIYIPDQVALAADHFFQKGNLIALRELALRVTAKRVGAQVLLYRKDQAIKHIWPSREKILVCVGPGLESLNLIRKAKQIATGLQAEWTAVYVDKPRFSLSSENRQNAIQNLRLAEQLGAQTRVLTGFDFVTEIMNFAREQNITQIMIWKNIRKRWVNLFFRSLADEIVRHSREIDVYIMTGPSDEAKPQSVLYSQKEAISWKIYATAIAVVLFTTAIDLFMYPYLRASNLTMIYLLGVAVVATFGRIGPAILASILSVIAYDYFFVPPFYSLLVADIEYLLSLVVMLIVAQVITQLTVMTRRQADAARLTEHHTSALYTLSKKLVSTRGIDKLLNAGIAHIGHIFDCEIWALFPKNGRLYVRAKFRTKQALDAKEQGVAEWVFELGQMAGLGTDSLSFSDSLYLPLLGSRGPLGVLRIRPAQPELISAPEQMNLLTSCANQIALALEVDRLQDKRRKSELKNEAERVRNSLLQAVSHDLRTPLVAIMGKASTQIELSNKLDVQEIEKIGKDIYFEAEQLNRIINNLLQITNMESNEIKLEKEVVLIKEAIATVIKAVQNKLGNRHVDVVVSDNIPPIAVDVALFQESLMNLIDNAIKFTPEKSPINIMVKLAEDKVIVSVRDYGPGIMVDEIDKLFEKFYRGRLLTEARGLGLGLAISRNIVKAHGGEIWAENCPDGGCVFSFSLPCHK